MDSYQTLVIILSATLAVLLVLIIVAMVKTIQILDHIKQITERAEHIAVKAEAVGDFFQKSAGPIAIGRLLTNLAEIVFQNSKSKKRQSKEDDDA